MDEIRKQLMTKFEAMENGLAKEMRESNMEAAAQALAPWRVVSKTVVILKDKERDTPTSDALAYLSNRKFLSNESGEREMAIKLMNEIATACF